MNESPQSKNNKKLTYILFFESAKSHASCAWELACFAYLRACVLTCLPCLRAYVLACLVRLRAYVLDVLGVLTCFRA